MQLFLLSDEIKLSDGRSLSALAEDAVFDKNYGFTREEIKEIAESGEKNGILTKDERAVFNEFMSEVTAHSAEAILGNESFIERVLKHDESLFKKLFDRIIGIRKTLTDSGEMSSEQIKKLHKAEKLYLRAAERAGNNRLVSYICDEMENEIKVSTNPDTCVYLNYFSTGIDFFVKL